MFGLRDGFGCASGGFRALSPDRDRPGQSFVLIFHRTRTPFLPLDGFVEAGHHIQPGTEPIQLGQQLVRLDFPW